MRIKITQPGIYNAKGEEIAVGTELTVKDEPKGWAGRYERISGGSEAKDKGNGKTAVTNPAKTTFKAPFEAKDKGNGWWGITDAAGAEVKALRKDDAEIFNALSDADKAKQVEEYQKDA